MASSLNTSTPRETNLTAQTRAPKQAPPCPICHQTDQVRTIQAAFDLGAQPIAPPAMPISNVRMMPWLVAGGFIYLAGNFYLLIELAANSKSGWPLVVQVLSTVVCLLGLLVGLVLSFIAIQRIVRGDREATARYPSWDRALANWNRLYYCLRDRVVLDPQQQRVLSEAELRSLISTDAQGPRQQHELLTHGDIHPPAAARPPATEHPR